MSAWAPAASPGDRSDRRPSERPNDHQAGRQISTKRSSYGRFLRTLPADVVARVLAERAAGSTLQAIVDRLHADAVPTARGGRCWRPCTVAAVLESIKLDQAATAA